MQSSHYPESLMRDYELLLSHFPSHVACRPPLIDALKQWESGYQGTRPLSILEVGPGYGETTQLILEAMPATLTLVETDSSAINRLRQNLAKFSQPVRMIEADATAWIKDEPSNTYDAFTASWTLHNFPKDQRDGFLRDVARVLRPGGLFFIFDKVLPDDDKEVARLWGIHTERLRGLDEAGRPELKQEMLAHEERDAAEPYAWKQRDLLSQMRELGFEQLTVHQRSERDIVFSAVRS